MSLSWSFLPEATEDIANIGFYFDQRSPALEERFYQAVDRTVQDLLVAPELGERLHLRSPKAKGIRIWRVSGFSNYLIFYRVVDEKLQIVRVLHGARNYAEEFDDK